MDEGGRGDIPLTLIHVSVATALTCIILTYPRLSSNRYKMNGAHNKDEGGKRWERLFILSLSPLSSSHLSCPIVYIQGAHGTGPQGSGKGFLVNVTLIM